MFKFFWPGAFIVYAALSPCASAHVVADTAPTGALGCFTKGDLIDIMRAGRQSADDPKNAKTIKVVAQKIKEYKCFKLEPGEIAFTDPSWQTQEDIWSGVTLFRSRSAIPFYSAGWTWRFVYDAPNAFEGIGAEGAPGIAADQMDASALLALEAKQDDDCRGGSGSDPATEAACRARDDTANKLKQLGYCYGEPGEFGYEMQWHKCGADSQR